MNFKHINFSKLYLVANHFNIRRNRTKNLQAENEIFLIQHLKIAVVPEVIKFAFDIEGISVKWLS